MSDKKMSCCSFDLGMLMLTIYTMHVVNCMRWCVVNNEIDAVRTKSEMQQAERDSSMDGMVEESADLLRP